jgi:hypothetical protein
LTSSRLAFVLIAVVIVSGGTAGCAGGDDEDAIVEARDLDRLALAVPLGASPEAVKDRLGPPSSEVDDNEGHNHLFYGRAARWNFAFDDDRLKSKVESLPTGPQMTSGSELNRKIMAMHPGVSIRAVESMLGEPRDHEIEYSDETVQRLFYSEWSLTFIDRHLDSRTRY